MSNEPSNNNITEQQINNTPSMETLDFFQYVMNRTQRMQIENDMPNSNFISSFLNHMDNSSNSTNMENIFPLNRPIPNTPPIQWTNDIWSSLVGDTSSNSTEIDNDSSNNINYDNADVYMRFLEDILQLPPLAAMSTNNNFRTLLRETLGEDKNPIKHVLSVDGEQKIETVEFDPEIYPDINCCPITIKAFKKGDMISKLPCNHLFNTDAILKWLKEEKAECPICRFKLESTEKKLERSDSSNNTVQDGRILRPRIPGTNTRLMHAFGPPRMPSRRHNAHLRRLMLSRHEQDEQEELQAALLASLEDQYMPGQPKTHKEDASDMDSDTNDMSSDANDMDSNTNDMDSNTNDMDSDISDMDFDISDMDFDTSDMDSDTNDMDAID